MRGGIRGGEGSPRLEKGICIQDKARAEATTLDGARKADRVAGGVRLDQAAGDRRPCLARDGRQGVRSWRGRGTDYVVPSEWWNVVVRTRVSSIAQRLHMGIGDIADIVSVSS